MTGASPRPGVREVEPYDSPQLDVAVRLNTNESPFPLPAGFFEDLSRGSRDLRHQPRIYSLAMNRSGRVRPSAQFR